MATDADCKGFLDAASVGNIKLLKRFGKILENHADVKDDQGRTALHLAAAAGNTKICEYLINKFNLDVNGRDNKGDTPLILAILERKSSTAMNLIHNGADVMASNDATFTALHFAAERGNEEIVQELISKGADVDLNSDAGTPLQCAALCGEKETLKVLLDNKADPNSTKPFYSPPLVLSILSCSFECFELLLEAGADPNIGSNGKTPLMVAATQGETKMIKYLLQFKADPNVTDANGETALQQAAVIGGVEAVKILFPVTSKVFYFPEWSVAGIMRHIASEEARKQREQGNQKYIVRLAKSKGLRALKRKDYKDAIGWYTEANVADPRDAIVLSSRSLCFAALKKGGAALGDARRCVQLKPYWSKAYYREGAAWMLLEKYCRAAYTFNKALKLNPNNKDIQKAYREALQSAAGDVRVPTYKNWYSGGKMDIANVTFPPSRVQPKPKPTKTK